MKYAVIIGLWLLLAPSGWAESIKLSDIIHAQITDPDLCDDPDIICTDSPTGKSVPLLNDISPCVQRAQEKIQQMLTYSTVGMTESNFFPERERFSAIRQTYALEAIALLLLDQRLGAECRP